MWTEPLFRTRRRLARSILYGLPLLAFAGALTFILVERRLHLDQRWSAVEWQELESVRLFQEFLRFDTAQPHGNAAPAAEFLARQLTSAGVPARVERLGERSANVWGIVEGREPGALVLHSHLDTDPVLRPELWRHPPFSGAIEGPFIYGRGAFDMKSYTIAQLLSVLDVARRGEPPRRSLIFLATGDEEVDSRLGTQWILRHHPELVGRFEAVLTEGGAVETVTIDEVKYWGTEIGQKRFVDVWVCDSNRERLESLRQTLDATELELQPPSPEVARFFRRYSPSRDHPDIRRLAADPERLLEDPQVDFLPRHLKALLRNEVVAFPVAEDPEGGYHMRVILHLMPGADLDQAWAELLPDGLAGFAFSVDVPHGPSGFSSTEHGVYRALHQFMNDTLPGVDHGPLVVPYSATDGRFFRAAGIPTFGFSPFRILSAEVNKMKGVNERLPLPAFVEGVERYSELVRRLVE